MLRYLVSGARVIHGEFPLRPKSTADSSKEKNANTTTIIEKDSAKSNLFRNAKILKAFLFFIY